MRKLAAFLGIAAVLLAGCSHTTVNQAAPPATSDSQRQEPAGALATPAGSAAVTSQPAVAADATPAVVPSRPARQAPRSDRTPRPAATPAEPVPPAQTAPAAGTASDTAAPLASPPNSSAETRRTPRQEEVWAQPPEPVPLPASPATPPEERVTLPPGTQLTVRALDRISSEDARHGETFAAALDQDLRQNGRVIIPANSDVTGRIVTVQESGKVKGRAELVMELESIAVLGKTYDLRTNRITLRAENSVKEDAAKIGGGAALGAIIGAIAGGKKGAAIGATIGGGSGTATVLATRGKPLVIDRETPLLFRLEAPLEVVVP